MQPLTEFHLLACCAGDGLANFVNPLQYLMPLDDYHESCSAPEKTSSYIKSSTSKQEDNKAQMPLCNNHAFSKSWPRLNSRKHDGQTLPKIPSNSSKNKSMDVSKGSSTSISTDIVKFNQSRAFRMRQNQKPSEKTRVKNVSKSNVSLVFQLLILFIQYQ